jgi:hypothetical protein
VTDQAIGQLDQGWQHPTPLHEVPRDDEEGDGQQGERVHSPEHQGGQDRERHRPRQRDEGETGQAETEGDGHAEGHGRGERQDQQDDGHAFTLSFWLSARCHSASCLAAAAIDD